MVRDTGFEAVGHEYEGFKLDPVPKTVPSCSHVLGFGEFDMLAVCMERSYDRWNSFLYVPERWLLPRPENSSLIKIMQPVPLGADEVFSEDFDEALRRLRSPNSRPSRRDLLEGL